METKHSRFIIVDDDPINNFITERVIKNISPQAEVKTFTQPEEGLDYVISTFAKADNGKAILLLDVNMPTMTGWQFIEHLEHEGIVDKDKLLIDILSSSVDPADQERARMHPLIREFIMKPLSPEAVLHLLE